MVGGAAEQEPRPYTFWLTVVQARRPEPPEDAEPVSEPARRLLTNIERVVVGKPDEIALVVSALISGGHERDLVRLPDHHPFDVGEQPKPRFAYGFRVLGRLRASGLNHGEPKGIGSRLLLRCSANHFEQGVETCIGFRSRCHCSPFSACSPLRR